MSESKVLRQKPVRVHMMGYENYIYLCIYVCVSVCVCVSD